MSVQVVEHTADHLRARAGLVHQPARLSVRSTAVRSSLGFAQARDSAIFVQGDPVQSRHLDRQTGLTGRPYFQQVGAGDACGLDNVASMAASSGCQSMTGVTPASTTRQM